MNPLCPLCGVRMRTIEGRLTCPSCGHSRPIRRAKPAAHKIGLRGVRWGWVGVAVLALAGCGGRTALEGGDSPARRLAIAWCEYFECAPEGGLMLHNFHSFDECVALTTGAALEEYPRGLDVACVENYIAGIDAAREAGECVNINRFQPDCELSATP